MDHHLIGNRKCHCKRSSGHLLSMHAQAPLACLQPVHNGHLPPPQPCAWAINSSSKTRSPENDVHNNNIFAFRLIGPVKAGKPKAVVYLTCKFCCFHCKENLHWLQREALPSLMTSGSPKDKYWKGKIFKWQQTKSGWGFVRFLFCFEWEATERRKDLVFNIRVRLWPSHTKFFAPVPDIYVRIATTLNLVSYSHFIMLTTGRGGGRFE